MLSAPILLQFTQNVIILDTDLANYNNNTTSTGSATTLKRFSFWR